MFAQIEFEWLFGSLINFKTITTFSIQQYFGTRVFNTDYPKIIHENKSNAQVSFKVKIKSLNSERGRNHKLTNKNKAFTKLH
jgi:hypothetical protein